MRILVTGRDGQLARSLSERLVDHELLFAGRPEVDLTERGSVDAAILAARPDAVINAAAYTAVDQAESEEALAFRINAEAAGEAAGAAAKVGASIIQLSTDYVFDGSGSSAYRETDLTAPQSAYGRSKLAGEQAVRAANPRHLILRTAWLYSPFGRNFVRTMLAAARQRDVLTVVEDQRGSPTSALDLADGIAAVLGRHPAEAIGGLWGTYHLANAGETSWYGFAVAIMDEARGLGLRSAEVRPIRKADWPTPARRPANSVLNSSRFARAFGFTMPHWRNSLAEVVRRIASDSPAEVGAGT
ncbi:MAG TPA: dTDP-4-dehydrorhamnose reductase [Sphingomicrobium sp.]|nr:dTDP-4-dehydrorhamnose reductase [Sphingomicrobium sp.]